MAQVGSSNLRSFPAWGKLPCSFVAGKTQPPFLAGREDQMTLSGRAEDQRQLDIVSIEHHLHQTKVKRSLVRARRAGKAGLTRLNQGNRSFLPKRFKCMTVSSEHGRGEIDDFHDIHTSTPIYYSGSLILAVASQQPTFDTGEHKRRGQRKSHGFLTLLVSPFTG